MAHRSPHSASVGLLPSMLSAGPPSRYARACPLARPGSSSGFNTGMASTGGLGGPRKALQKAA
eukprot:8677975-Alexandrium_andersonii.AAC.1